MMPNLIDFREFRQTSQSSAFQSSQCKAIDGIDEQTRAIRESFLLCICQIGRSGMVYPESLGKPMNDSCVSNGVFILIIPCQTSA